MMAAARAARITDVAETLRASRSLNLNLARPLGHVVFSLIGFNPKGPRTYIVYTWALKLLYRNPFKA